MIPGISDKQESRSEVKIWQKRKALDAAYKAKGFEIVGVSIDENKGDWKKAIIADGLPWIQLVYSTGTDGPLCKHYDIRAVPTQILIDKEGRVIAYSATIEETEKILEEKIFK
jgi:Thioredoxin-like